MKKSLLAGALGAALAAGGAAAQTAGAPPAASPAAAAPAPASDAAPAAPLGLGSWTSDRRDYAVGDVITVLLDEYTLASKNAGDFATDRRQRDNSLSVGQTVTTALPGVGADVSSRNDAESRVSGQATRQSRFQGEMTVRVVAVEAGRLRIEGTKVVDVDKNHEEIALKGWVRPQDVSTRNTVDSWRIGNAEIAYTSKGGLSKPRGGILGRLLGALWP